MITDILIALAKANIAAAVPILAVMALRRWARGRLGARAAYGLWLAPLLAAGAVFLPHPAAREALPATIAPIVLQAESAADVFVAEAVTAAPQDGPDAPALAFAAWLAGGVLAAGLLARRQARFVASLGRLTPMPGRRLFRAERAGVGPAVVGVLRPKVVAPADFETRFAEAERTLILAHEAQHLSAHDAAINALACLARCVCWFNPLVHVAARLMRMDQELACDAAVVGRFPEQRRAYAELLLKTQLFTQPLPLGCHWPAGAEHPLKARIAMLKSPLPAPAVRRLGAAVTLAGCAGAAGLAWAASPAATASADADGPGPAERAAAKALDDLHPNYSCDRAIETSGGNCKIVRISVWQAVPTHADLMRHYPAEALKAGMTADVWIDCGLSDKGLLIGCTAGDKIIKAPDGVTVGDDLRDAFGDAAVAVSRYYQSGVLDWAPKTGRPGHAHLKIAFNPDAAADSRLPGPPGSVPARPMPPPASQVSATPGKLLAAFQTHAPVITKPDWIEKPVPADVAEFYPKAAVAAHIEAWTTLHCAVAATGELKDCQVTREEPMGQGFGDAALALAAKFRMKPQTRDGVPTAGGEINIPIRFALPAGPAVDAQPAQAAVAEPVWVRKPSTEDMAQLYPLEARKARYDVIVTATCQARVDGAMADCRLGPVDISSDVAPTKALTTQFYDATLKLLMTKFQMAPQLRDGRTAAGSTIRIPVRWLPPAV